MAIPGTAPFERPRIARALLLDDGESVERELDGVRRGHARREIATEDQVPKWG